jgi:hypothetical protein
MKATGCEPFDRWCVLRNEDPLPASPNAVARFIADVAPHGIEKVWPLVAAISRAHYVIGLADPTGGGPVSAALNAIARIDPPRSWPKEQKFRFTSLPYDLQVYVAGHEARREKEIRRAQSETAKVRQELAAIQTSAKVTNGTPETAAA